MIVSKLMCVRAYVSVCLLWLSCRRMVQAIHEYDRHIPCRASETKRMNGYVRIQISSRRRGESLDFIRIHMNCSLYECIGKGMLHSMWTLQLWYHWHCCEQNRHLVDTKCWAVSFQSVSFDNKEWQYEKKENRERISKKEWKNKRQRTNV